MVLNFELAIVAENCCSTTHADEIFKLKIPFTSF